MIGITIRTRHEDTIYCLDINQSDGSVGFQVLKDSDKKFQLDFIIEPNEWELIKTFIDESLKNKKSLQTFIKQPIKE